MTTQEKIRDDILELVKNRGVIIIEGKTNYVKVMNKLFHDEDFDTIETKSGTQGFYADCYKIGEMQILCSEKIELETQHVVKLK